MTRFLIGFVLGVAAILLGMYCYVRFGFVDPRADTEVGALEQKAKMRFTQGGIFEQGL